MKLKLSRYYSIAILVIAVIISSQAYWLYNTYSDNKILATKEINTTLKEYTLDNMETFFGEMVERDTTIDAADLEKLKLVQGLIQDLSKISNHPDENITIKFSDNRDTINNSQITKDTIAKKLRVLHSEIAEALKENKIGINFDIVLFNNTDSTRIDTIDQIVPDKSELRSDNFTLHSSKQYFYISVKNSKWYLLKKMQLTILFSCILILLSVFVFIIFLQTIIKQLRLNQLKNDFVNNMTHELKTPLATCSAALESIEKFNVIDDKEKTLKYIGLAQNEIQRIKTLTDMILTSSSIENKTLIYHFERTYLNEIIQNTLQGFQLQIAERQITLNTELTDHSVFLNADKLHLSNVISNLLDNAIKYNQQNGTITILVKKKNKHIEILVSNTGSGFPKEYAEKVFDKFFRVPSNDIHNVKGYGLGLNYAKNVVEAHKGSINIKSDMNELTVLTIILPVYE